ncbi:DUF4880 domain-containing protein [Klebsiella indica]|uniref:DUF4880 domain-containing protein n=1 Tax=Klebsiella indica TaxID=2582917 RepID=A0A5R9L988_9ENTR|nr:DUF4880 domain-containing protein [Klebsiella indica]TLV04995.1 DUF4880 domain-containing protein [Klebsiella indica]
MAIKKSTSVSRQERDEQALFWVVRLTSGDASDADLAHFARWRHEPDNEIALSEARRLWISLGNSLEQWHDLPVDTQAAANTEELSVPQRKKFLRWAGGVLVLVLVILAVSYVWQTLRY